MLLTLGQRWILSVLCLCVIVNFAIALEDFNDSFDYDDDSSNETAWETTDDENGKIIGGEVISIDKIPCLVSLQYRPIGFGDTYYHRCGAALISAKYVITAAHCMVRVTEPSQLQIRAGSSHQTTGGQVKTVYNYTIHPKYNKTTYNYDVAILELTGRIWVAQPKTFIGRFFQGLAGWLLPRTPRICKLNTDLDFPDNAMFYTAGWGTTTTAVGGQAVDTLYGLSMPFINRTTCARMYPVVGRITDYMFCAGFAEGGKDTCQGDSGGPIIYKDEIIGVVSWGDGCAKANKPGVYARIAMLKDFINENAEFDN